MSVENALDTFDAPLEIRGSEVEAPGLQAGVKSGDLLGTPSRQNNHVPSGLEVLFHSASRKRDVDGPV